MSTSTDGGQTWSTPVVPRRQAEGPRRPAGRAARWHRDRPVRGAERQDRGVHARPTAARPGATLAVVDNVKSHGELGRPAHEPAADGRDRRRRQRLRGVAGLPLPAQVLGQRHRVQQVVGRRQLEQRPRGSRSRTCGNTQTTTSSRASASTRPPRARRAPRADVLLLHRRQLRAGGLRAAGRHDLVARRRRHWGGQDTVGPSMTLDQIARLAGQDGRRLHLDVVHPRAPYTTAVDGRQGPANGKAFDEGMYAPTAPITSPRAAQRQRPPAPTSSPARAPARRITRCATTEGGTRHSGDCPRSGAYTVPSSSGCDSV